MPHVIPYGVRSQLQLKVPAQAVLADCTLPKGQPLEDPVAAVAAALADPVGFPPLARATVPGDQIVLALGRDVPRADAVVAGVVHTLMEGGAEPEQIVVVSEDELFETPPTGLLAPSLQSAIRVVVHDPDDKNNLCYLAASKEGLPIYFNRLICEADVVLPINCLRLEESFAYIGVHGGLFPSFSDRATRERFCTPKNLRAGNHLQHRRQESDEAAWLLGVQFTIQVVPGPGVSILHVLAGDALEVSRRGQQLCEAAWLYRVPQKASLVVASIEGGPQQQTWVNFARALFAAGQIVSTNGTIVLCTELQERLGPALQRLRSVFGDDEALRDFGRDQSPDAVAASLLLETREHAHVYLISDLEGDVVEELGLGYVTDPGDIDRLSEQHESCILLANAHQALGQVSL